VKSSSIAIAVLLGLSGTPVAAEPIRLAQTFAADVIPPYEVFTIIRSMGMRPLGRPQFRGRFYVVHAIDPRGEEVRIVVDAYAARVVSVQPLDRQAAREFGGPTIPRRYESDIGPAPRFNAEPRDLPPAPPRRAEPDPRFGAPQAEPEDDDGIESGDQPDDFESEDDDDTGSLSPRGPQRAIGAPRVSPDVGSPAIRSATGTQPKTPLPRPRPDQLATVTPAETQAPAAPATTPASDSKNQSGKSADGKPDAAGDAAKSEAPKSGIRVIEIKKPEPRI
jgi:hypothetical protein